MSHHLGAVEALLAQPGILVDERDDVFDLTALMLAALISVDTVTSRSAAVVESLIRAEADPNLPTDVASKLDNVFGSIFQLDVDKDIEVKKRLTELLKTISHDGAMTALHIASLFNRGGVDIAPILLEHPHLNFAGRSDTGATALHYASPSYSNRDAITKLIRTSTLFTVINNERATALMIAVEFQSVDMVDALLAEKHIRLDLKDRRAYSALDYATNRSAIPYPELYQRILAAMTAAVAAADSEGATVESFVSAIRNGDVARVQHLISNAASGVMVTAVDDNGWSALMIAVKHGSAPIVELLLHQPQMKRILIAAMTVSAIRHSHWRSR